MPPLVVDLPFGVSVDISFWLQIFTWPVFDIVRVFFVILGWAFLALIFFYMAAPLFASYRQSKKTSAWKPTVLAVDIPEENIQTPSAVEQIFSHLSGIKADLSIADRYWSGEVQKWFSLEIVSMEGYLQFLIYTEEAYRDLVEAAIYAQYPLAEITEVEDYTNILPDKLEESGYDIVGSEFTLIENSAYPIRTYHSFEVQGSKDVMFNDPMAALLENFSRVGEGEYFWMQIALRPSDGSWKEKGIELVKSIIAQKKETKNGIFSKFGSLPMAIAELATQVWDWNFIKEEKADEAKKVGDLTPGMKSVVESIEEKISKIGFESKIRTLYAAKQPVFNPSKCLEGFVGSLNQFFHSSRNGLVPKNSAKSKKDMAKAESFLKAYKGRVLDTGSTPCILNIEELATLWHFPLAAVKTPLLQKTGTKRSQPPIDLPLDIPFETEEFEDEFGGQEKSAPDGADQIPTDQGFFGKDMPYG